MPCDYSKYPADWKTHRVPRILAREGNDCKFCGARNGSIGYRGIEGDWWQTASAEDRIARKLQTPPGCGLTRIVLTVAHLKRTTGDPAKDGPLDCPDEDLAALCQACHLSLDRERHLAKRKQTIQARRAVASLFEEASHD